MADQPRQQQPYSNMTPATSFVPTKPDGSAIVPKGPKGSKTAQGELALKGLIGARM